MQPITIHSLTPDRQAHIITTTQPQLAKHYKALKNKGHHQITVINQPTTTEAVHDLANQLIATNTRLVQPTN